MSAFRTIVEVPKSKFKITHQSKIMMLGSCFAENIGAKLLEIKFNIDLNPFGIIFNPISVEESLRILMENNVLTENDLFFHNEKWNSFLHHSRFSNIDKQKCLQAINQRIKNSVEFLKTADYLFLTFGTAWVYYFLESGKPVSNCHKLPANRFERRMLEIKDIVLVYKDVIEKLKKINSNLKIILTVSPVRHLKDGAEGNQLSKASLIVAVNELCKSGLTEYFPAYEIVLDDLRDYRFYNNDMVHPNELAIDYIFEKFSNSFFETPTIELNNELEKIAIALKHRPINEASEGFKNFINTTIAKINIIENTHPYINFSTEKENFKSIK
jgi:hypothetical protein